MRKVSLCWLALAFYWCEGFGQTNCPVPLGLFSLPHMEMKKLECEPEGQPHGRRNEASKSGTGREALVEPAILANVSTNRSLDPGTISLSSSDKDDSFQTLDIYRRLDDGGYLTSHNRPDSLLRREMDAMYRPEVFHLGKTTIRCSLISAIRHKDPLCLLNLDDPESIPSVVFFKLSW